MELFGRARAVRKRALRLAFRTRAVAFVVVIVVGSGEPTIALAQVQGDAALADVPDEKPAPTRSPGPSGSGSDRRSQTTSSDPEPDLDPPTTTAELRAAHPDLQVRVTPPPTFTVMMTSVYPFQTLGIGIGGDVYGMKGISPQRRAAKFTSRAGLACKAGWPPVCAAHQKGVVAYRNWTTTRGWCCFWGRALR